MSFITVEPLSDNAEHWLTKRWNPMEALIETMVHQVWEIPLDDIIIRGIKNSTLPVSSRAQTRGVMPDFVIYLSTSDEAPLSHTDELKTTLARALVQTFGLRAEIQFIRLVNWAVTFGPYAK